MWLVSGSERFRCAQPLSKIEDMKSLYLAMVPNVGDETKYLKIGIDHALSYLEFLTSFFLFSSSNGRLSQIFGSFKYPLHYSCNSS